MFSQNTKVPFSMLFLSAIGMWACTGSKDDNTGGVFFRGPGSEDLQQGETLDVLEFDGIPPWSFGAISLDIMNSGDDTITINDISLEGVGETESVEWYLTEAGALSVLDVDFSDMTINAGESLSFGLYFRPVYSGNRDVTVRVSHTGGNDAYIVVHGRGRDNGTKSPVLASNSEWIFGRSNVSASNDIMVGPLLHDGQDLILAGNVNGWDDTFSENLVLGKISTSGTVKWLKEWKEDYEQSSHDIGDNGDFGGSAHSISLDSSGNIFLTGRRSQSSSNNIYQAMVVKIKGSDGSMLWAKGVTGGNNEIPQLASENLQSSVIDASISGRVLVAGKVADSGGMLLMALDSNNGDLLWAKTIVSSGTSRAGAILVDGNSAYIGGVANNKAFLAKIDGVSGSNPSLSWSKSYGSYGVIRSLDLEDNDLLIGYEKRGLPTSFVGAVVNATDGSLRWAKVWDAENGGDNNNSLVAKIVNGEAVVAGRVAISPFDTQGGDGFIMRLDMQDGAWINGSFFYNGKGAEELTWHHITAIAEDPNNGSLWTLSQATPGSLNQNHFWGRWYEATDNEFDFPGEGGGVRLVDYSMDVESVSATLNPISSVTAHSITYSNFWSNATSGVILQDAYQAEQDGVQVSVHALIQNLVHPSEVNTGSSQPSSEPSSEPTSEPSTQPSSEPTSEPSTQPSSEPTSEPTSDPTGNDDRYEENDTFNEAALITPGTYTGFELLDPDYYKIDVCTGGTITVDILFTHANGDLDLHLYDAGFSEVVSSLSTDDNESLTYTSTASSNVFYYLYVEGYQGATNTYDMNISITCN